jgi:hypothetical protein
MYYARFQQVGTTNDLEGIARCELQADALAVGANEREVVLLALRALQVSDDSISDTRKATNSGVSPFMLPHALP